MTALTPAWADLLEALNLLAQHPTDPTSPFNCTHDTLHVLADDTAFTDAEVARLSELGFDRDTRNGGFYSFRYGSA